MRAVAISRTFTKINNILLIIHINLWTTQMASHTQLIPLQRNKACLGIDMKHAWDRSSGVEIMTTNVLGVLGEDDFDFDVDDA